VWGTPRQLTSALGVRGMSDPTLLAHVVGELGAFAFRKGSAGWSGHKGPTANGYRKPWWPQKTGAAATTLARCLQASPSAAARTVAVFAQTVRMIAWPDGS
jgi:hypothetical protein